MATCECNEQICYHIGALALHSGYKTPIFSYTNYATETTSSTTLDLPIDETDAKNGFGSILGSEAVKIENLEKKFDAVDSSVNDNGVSKMCNWDGFEQTMMTF